MFFSATLTGRQGSHTSFVQAGAETTDTGAENLFLIHNMNNICANYILNISRKYP